MAETELEKLQRKQAASLVAKSAPVEPADEPATDDEGQADAADTDEAAG